MADRTACSSPGSSRRERGHPGAARELDGGIVEVDADDPAARREQDARRELADEAEPDHADPLADAHLGLADAVQRDRADGGVGRVVEADARRDVDDEVLRHGDDLGVVRPAATAAGDPVAGRDPLDAGSDLEHDAGGRVAERRERGEPVAGDTDRGADTLDAGAVDDLLDEVGAGARLLEEVLLAGLDLGALGAGADQGEAVGDEQPARAEGGCGNIDDADRPVTRTLCDLLHD